MSYFKKIDIEGTDGCGKTTLAKAYAEKYNYPFSYEPDGATPLALQLRKLALDAEHKEALDGIPREYLMAASRALSNKKNLNYMKTSHVISDRGLLSGMVYANVDDKLNMSFQTWGTLHSSNLDTLKPDLIVYITNKERRSKGDRNKGNDIYDNRDDAFFSKISKTFLDGLTYFEIEYGVPHIVFENSFDLTVEENCDRLHALLTPFLHFGDTYANS